MMENTKTEHLSLCVCSQICLKAERVDGGDEGLDDIQRRARDWGVLRHVTSVKCKMNVLYVMLYNC